MPDTAPVGDPGRTAAAPGASAADLASASPCPDVVVVGGGVVGVACAVELARRGVAVTVLERDRVGHGCSYGNAGWLTPSQAVPLANPSMLFKSFRWMLDPESPLYIQPRLDAGYLRWLIEFLLNSRKSKFEPGAMALVELCRVSTDMWESFAKESAEDFGFERHGLLAVYEKTESFEAAHKTNALVGRAGVRMERWSADEVRDREPAVIGKTVGAYYFPDDAHCKPYLAVKALADAARAAGVTFVEDAEVFKISQPSTSGPRVLSTTKGDIAAHQIVLAAGSWSEDLGAQLDHPIGRETEEGRSGARVARPAVPA